MHSSYQKCWSVLAVSGKGATRHALLLHNRMSDDLPPAVAGAPVAGHPFEPDFLVEDNTIYGELLGVDLTGQ